MSAVTAVPFLDLSTAFKALEAEWLETIRASGAKGSFILGPQTVEFEKEFANYVGVKHAIGVANAPIHWSCRCARSASARVTRSSPHRGPSSPAAESISIVGATPGVVDIRPDTYCLDPTAS